MSEKSLKRLDEAIAHFDTVATFGKMDGKPARMHEEVAAYLKRLKYYEEAIKSGHLVWKEG